MNKSDFDVLFKYNRWAWERLLAQVARVTPDQYLALAPVPHGSLRGTLVHALAADVNWRQRCEGNSPTKLLNELDMPTFAGLQTRWQAEAQAFEDLIAGLSDADLEAPLHYKTTKGVPMTDVLWHVLAHVINHSTQHRAEAAMLLTSFGYSPGDLDLISFLRDER